MGRRGARVSPRTVSYTHLDVYKRQIQDQPLTRDRAYASLLAIENRVERIVLDMEKREDENRTSNALRFMNKFASSPAATWSYLEGRMQPYLKKLRSKRMGWAQNIEERISALNIATVSYTHLDVYKRQHGRSAAGRISDKGITQLFTVGQGRY